MYGKTFASLWQGSMIGRPDDQLVFVFLISHADGEGYVDIHPHMIAALTGLSSEVVRKALDQLEGPDPQSRIAELDGRRLERIDAHRDWGWRIVNYLHYRGLRDKEERKKQNREAQARKRAGQPPSAGVSHGQPPSAQGEGEGEGEGDKKNQSLPQPTASRSASRRSAVSDPPGFAEFYDPFPRHVARAAAVRAYRRALKDHPDLSPETLAAGAQRYAAERDGKDQNYTTHPATWLNAGRWMDEPGTNGETSDEQWDREQAERSARIQRMIQEKTDARKARQP